MDAERCELNACVSPKVKQIGVIVNVHAGGIRRQAGIVRELTALVGSRGEVWPTTNAVELHHALLRGRARGVDTVAVCGGDGTNLHTLTAMAEVYRSAPWPRITLLPAGTLNTAAANFGCVGPIVTQLRRLIEADEPRVLSWPLLRVNDHVGFIFGTHLVARILDAYYAGRVGPAGAVLLATRIVASSAIGSHFSRGLFRREVVDVEVDGAALGSLGPTGLMASVIPAPAVGMRALYKAGEGGAFHVVGVDAPPTRIFSEAGRLWCGLPIACAKLDVTARQLTLRFSTPARYTMDGDLFQSETIRLTATDPVEMLLPPLD
jgi:hypothetical protein